MKTILCRQSHRTTAYLLVVFLATLFLALAVVPSAQAYDDQELEFLSLINSYRQQNGLPRLTMSNGLYVASEGHSQDMGVNNYFSHNSLDGRTPWDRIRAAGYNYNTWLGENIAAGYTSAQAVFDAWRASPGHNANMLSANFRAIGIGRVYVAGSQYGWYWTTDFGGVSEDVTPPSLSIPSPTGSSLVSGTVIFTANASDNVAVTRVNLYIDGVLVASKTTAPFNFTWDTSQYSQGTHQLRAIAWDTADLTSDVSIDVTVDNFTASQHYFFTWYDQSDANWRDWVLMANPASGAAQARTCVLVGGTTYADRSIDVGAPAETPSFPGVMGGPAMVATTEPLISSQRVIYKNSFNEIPAVPQDSLESTYYFTWYDSDTSGGMKGDWILVSNQGDADANVEIYIGGRLKGAYTVPPGGQITPSFPNTTDGPVKVTSTNGQPLIVSQRVLYLDSFNEVLGVPESKLSTEYHFTWYDSKPENNMRGNWILIGNQDFGDALVDVYIGEELMGSYTIPEGGRVTPQFENFMDGPVRVTCTNGKRLIVSQRILYKSSFEEVQGMVNSDFGTDLWFTWYDSLPANGMYGNWVLVANRGTDDAIVEIYIDSALREQLTIPVGGNVPLSFPATMGGPVRVVSVNGQNLLATQRVIYRDSFNEIGGMKLR